MMMIMTTTTSKNSGTTNTVLTVCMTSPSDWFVDSDATKHVTNQCDIFVAGTFKKLDSRHNAIRAANRESIATECASKVEMLSFVGNRVQRLTLVNVWYVPKVSRNLFCVLAAQDKNRQSARFKSSTTE